MPQKNYCEKCKRQFACTYAWHYFRSPHCRDDPVLPDLEGDSTGDSEDEELAMDTTFIDAQIKHATARFVSDLRFQYGLDDSGIAFLMSSWKSLSELADKKRLANVREMLKSDVSAEQFLAASPVDVFKGLTTHKRQFAEEKKGLPYLEPRKVDLDGETVASFDVGTLLERKLQRDAKFRERVLQKSDEWKLGENHGKVPVGKMRDFDDGVAARFHPHLMRKATADEQQDCRIALDVNVDDIEVPRARCSLTLSRWRRKKPTGIPTDVGGAGGESIRDCAGGTQGVRLSRCGPQPRDVGALQGGQYLASRARKGQSLQAARHGASPLRS